MPFNIRAAGTPRVGLAIAPRPACGAPLMHPSVPSSGEMGESQPARRGCAYRRVAAITHQDAAREAGVGRLAVRAAGVEARHHRSAARPRALVLTFAVRTGRAGGEGQAAGQGFSAAGVGIARSMPGEGDTGTFGEGPLCFRLVDPPKACPKTSWHIPAVRGVNPHASQGRVGTTSLGVGSTYTMCSPSCVRGRELQYKNI